MSTDQANGPVRLEELTWIDVEAYLKRSPGIILPTGSLEQHGPAGLLGTDAICAREIAWRAARRAGGLVAPEVTYAPAPFNMSFPGTVSLSVDLYAELTRQIAGSLISHGFSRIYILNGHGANLESLNTLPVAFPDAEFCIRSWWDFETVNRLRGRYYGEWEGMHATPSEVAITQATHRVVNVDDLEAPRKLSPEFIRAHAGDRHGPPDEHRKSFPDGRVGSHSTLARPEHGIALLDAAEQSVADDYLAFLTDGNARA